MAGRWGLETGIDEMLIARLLEEQAPRLAGLRAVKVRDGWDNAVWRLGDSLAIRITQRAVAAGLHQHEQRWLPGPGARPSAAGSSAGDRRRSQRPVSLALECRSVVRGRRCCRGAPALPGSGSARGLSGGPCRFSFTMSLSRIACRLNVACDMFVRI
jgi:hypothetical protein